MAPKSRKTYGRGHQRSRTEASVSASLWDGRPIEIKTTLDDISVKQRPCIEQAMAAITKLKIHNETVEETEAPTRKPLQPLSRNASLNNSEKKIRKEKHPLKSTQFSQTHEESPIQFLREVCGNVPDAEFDKFVESCSRYGSISKLGEASYSEVFAIRATHESHVLKVMPLESFNDSAYSLQVAREIQVTKRMSSFDGFVKFIRYPNPLLRCWKEYEHVHGTENADPATYDDDQVYCIVKLQNAGVDLEHFELHSWDEAKSIFWSVCRSLALGEREMEFEHRDLHWGNIVIQEDVEPANIFRRLSIKAGFSERSPRTLKTTLIDYTLSRVKCSDGSIAFTDLVEPELFTGKGDYQFDVYRFMKRHVSREEKAGVWSGFFPKTNVLWLHYLADILLHHKALTPAAKKRFNDNETANTESAAYKCLLKVWKALNPRRKVLSGKSASLDNFADSQAVLDWAVKESLPT